MTYLQVKAGNIAVLIFGLGTVVVYLVLAATYENWRLPLAVILDVSVGHGRCSAESQIASGLPYRNDLAERTHASPSAAAPRQTAMGTR